MSNKRKIEKGIERGGWDGGKRPGSIVLGLAASCKESARTLESVRPVGKERGSGGEKVAERGSSVDRLQAHEATYERDPHAATTRIPFGFLAL